MAKDTINFTINLNGTAYTGIAQIDKALGKLGISAQKTETLLNKINNSAFKFNTIFQTVQTLADKVSTPIKKMICVVKSETGFEVYEIKNPE